ncbi:MAG: glycosyltransferase family 39 protein, partial [Nanoarchaeota archaeon]|nr:glycosyltransferase family 39 protein [Nanoarchaeota archaeon]
MRDTMERNVGGWIRENKVWILLALIVTFGFILRVYALGSPVMWIDETISSLAMQNILEKGIPQFDSGLFYGRALVFHYISALFLWLIGGDFGPRFLSVLIGTGTIVLAFFAAREFSWKKNEKNDVAGLVAALFTAVLFIEIVYSRQARFYQMFQFLFFLTLWFLYKFRTEKGRKYSWLASVSFILLVDTHIAGIVLVPFLIYVFGWERRDWKLLIIPAIVSVYYLQGLLNVAGSSGTALASQYAGGYYSGIFYYLRAFAIFSLIGLIPAWIWNKRMTLILVLPSLVLLGGVLINRLYGLRYVYFVFLVAPVLIGVLFSFIYRERKWLFFILLILTLVYPSNAFFSYGRMTMVYPQNFDFETSSEP